MTPSGSRALFPVELGNPREAPLDDVAGGVESAPGREDVEKIQRFIQNARDAAARLGCPASWGRAKHHHEQGTSPT